MQLQNEIQYMKLAIQEARRSQCEDDRPHPYVGVVVVRGDQILASSCRGDLSPGDHAEFTALEKKLPRETLAGCTVYTTLEPCTTRRHPKQPCADRLIARKVRRVVIGMLDPDQRITGKGVLRLRRAGIAVDLFPPDLMAEIEELNRDFTRDRESLVASQTSRGIEEAGLTTFYPSRDFYSRLRQDAATIDLYVSTATTSAVMVSINLMTGIPFHDLCICLKEKLKMPKGIFRASISLLDPRRPELMNVMAKILNNDPNDLAASITKSLKDLVCLKKSLPQKARTRFDIRVHPALPFGSAILLDHELQHGRIQIETKPYKVGLQKSFAFEIVRSQPGGLYDVLVEAYCRLLTEGESVDIEETGSAAKLVFLRKKH